MKDLEEARNIIDKCDKELVKIFERRLNAVLDVLEYKRKHALPIFQGQREKEVFKKVNSYLQNDEFSNELDLLYGQILKISRQVQSKALFPFNIIIIGFMGSGKTSVGMELSKLLEMKYMDTDEIIIKNTNMSINHIFEKFGEGRFRELEANTLEDLQNINNTIISCGGGIILNPKNIKLLKQLGKVIWLKVSPKEAYNRLLGDSSRPLLKDDFSLTNLTNILEKRLTLYENASDIIIETDGKNFGEICDEIIKNLLKCDSKI